MNSNFKVIIAGGGPAGLVAAHSLQLAGIDFTVLEQRDNLAEDQGASLVLAPQSLRVMSQFGILDRLMDIGAELVSNTAYSRNGQQLGEDTSFYHWKDNFGIGPHAFHRASMIDVIYDGLPEEAKARVLTGKKIINVESSQDGVIVTCADGSVFNGSVLIGADGAHSRVRRQMRRLALEDNVNTDWDPDTPYASEYKVLWCSFPAVAEPGHGTVTHSKDHSAMSFAGKTRGWFFLFSKLPGKTKDRVSYSDQDVAEYIDTFADYTILPGYTVKDLYARRFTAGMSNLEEGVVEHWSWGRIALVGDACHKYTPNKGLGLNNGVQDVVALCNELVAAVHASPNASPTLDTLTHAFQAYTDERRALAVEGYLLSAKETRIVTYSTFKNYVIGHYLYWWHWFQHLMLQYIAPCSIRKGLVLDYVYTKELVQGAVGWLHPMKQEQ